jgi:hypothetical protein
VPAASIVVVGGEFVGLQRADDTKEGPADVEEAARDLSHL